MRADDQPPPDWRNQNARDTRADHPRDSRNAGSGWSQQAPQQHRGRDQAYERVNDRQAPVAAPMYSGQDGSHGYDQSRPHPETYNLRPPCARRTDSEQIDYLHYQTERSSTPSVAEFEHTGEQRQSHLDRLQPMNSNDQGARHERQPFDSTRNPATWSADSTRTQDPPYRPAPLVLPSESQVRQNFRASVQDPQQPDSRPVHTRMTLLAPSTVATQSTSLWAITQEIDLKIRSLHITEQPAALAAKITLACP